MNILIIEDDEYQRNTLHSITSSINEDIQVNSLEKGTEALEHIKKEKADLFLVDIELPDVSGLDLSKKIRKIKGYELTQIIFITTHIQFQLNAFKEIHCYDFIEKPYKKEDIVEAVGKIYYGRKSLNDEMDSEEFIYFKMKNCSIKIQTNDILFMESKARHLYIHTYTKKYLIKNISMKKSLNRIKDKSIIRTHRAYSVNINNIESIEKKTNKPWEIYFRNYSEIAYAGKTYKDKFSKEYDNYIRKEKNNEL